MRKITECFDQMLSVLIFITFNSRAVNRYDITEQVLDREIRTAQRYLKDLEELGFIQSKRRKGYNTTIFYEPTDKAKQLFKVTL